MKPIRLENKFYLPDSILHLRTNEPKDLLFCLEFHNGWNVKEIVSQLDRHVEILQSGALASRFGLPIDHRVLSVYEHPSCMKRVLERIKSESRYKYMRYYFLFKCYKELIDRPLVDWHHMD